MKAMNDQTAYMGEVDIPDDDQIVFPAGLPGWPDRTRFAVLFHEEMWPFYHLQSLEEAQLCFLTVDPFAFFRDYDFQLPEAIVEQLEIHSPEDIWVRNIVVVAEDFRQSTVNLQAPVVINHRRRLGRQVILNDSRYAVKHPLFSKQAAGSGER